MTARISRLPQLEQMRDQRAFGELFRLRAHGRRDYIARAQRWVVRRGVRCEGAGCGLDEAPFGVSAGAGGGGAPAGDAEYAGGSYTLASGSGGGPE